MRILLVCVSGLTTSMLAKKMRIYNEENNLNNIVTATKVFDFDAYLEFSDVILVAPQAMMYSKIIEDKSKEKNIPVLYLSEDDLVFMKIENIFQSLDTLGKTDVGVIEKVELSVHLVFEITKDAFIRCSSILVIGLIAIICDIIKTTEYIDVLYKSTFGIIGIIYAFSIGFTYGEKVKSQIFVNGLLTLTSVFIMNPIIHAFINPNLISITLNNQYLFSSIILLMDLIPVTFVSLLTIFFSEKIEKYIMIHIPDTSYSYFYEPMIKYGIVFLFFSILRFLFEIFL